MLAGEKQQRGPLGQGVMFPESGEGKIPREQEEKEEERGCARIPFGKREAAALCYCVCIRPSKETLKVC